MDGWKSEPSGKRARRGGGELTVADVALHAGVSPMTVSRVINRKTNVQPATRTRVEEAIAELGYVPNPAARSLASKQMCRIALLHSNPCASYLSAFLMGGLAGANEANAQLVVEIIPENETSRELVNRLAGNRIDAVLPPAPLSDDPELIAALQERNLLFLQIAPGSPIPSIGSISISDEVAAHAMTTHILGLGHRRIGFITGDPSHTASTRRRAGYERALREAGLPVDEQLIAEGDFTYRSGLTATELLLSREPRPTALFASNDDMAAAAIAAVHRHGLEVPGDITICGFDDSAMATMVWPEITTIRQPIADMAHRAILRLAEVTRNKATGSRSANLHETVDFELIVRASDGPPPSA